MEEAPAAIFQSKAATRHRRTHAFVPERPSLASFRAPARDGRMRHAILEIGMKRRTFITLLGAATAWPFLASIPSGALAITGEVIV